jgi:hypothetical protein
MMKRFLFIYVLITFFIGCDSENAWDCFQDSGEIIQEEFELDGFKKIIIWNRVKLYISEGPVQQVVVETGSNLMNEIRVRVEDSILKVSDRNSCNYVREYGLTKVYVTSPNIEVIRNSSGLAVESIGTISYNELELISEDPDLLGEFHKDGDFIMDNLNLNILRVNANGLSKFFLRGKVIHAHIGAADGDVRIEAGELEVQNMYIFHRSTNDMIVNPRTSIRGKIIGLGDVIAKNHPPIVEVEELFTGRLIFE